MKMDIKNEMHNRFLKRKELNINIEHTEESTPSAAAVQQMISKQTGSQLEKVEIKEIISARGASISKCLAFVWDEKIVKDLSKKPEKETGENASEAKE